MSNDRLTGNLEAQGRWMFRHRGIAGIVLLPVLGLALVFPGPLAFRGDRAIDLLSTVGLLLSLAGLALRWCTVGFVPHGTSGRNTREQRAEQLNTEGMYSIVRHPLYVANAMVMSGFVLAANAWWLLLLFWLGYALFIERVIAAEEAFLQSSYGEAWQAWATTTPTFLPAWRQWRAPALEFSLRTVLRREYNGLFGVCTAFFVLEAARDVLIQGQSWQRWLSEDRLWAIMFAFGICVLVVLRTLKRRSRHLHVSGR